MKNSMDNLMESQTPTAPKKDKKPFWTSFYYNAPVTLTFAIVSLLVLVLGWITGGWTTQHLFSVYASSMSNPLYYVRLFGHVLGHSDLSHYVNNMMMLLLLGPIVEEKYGSRDLLFMMCVTAVITGILNNIFFTSGLLGASGIVFMMIVLASATSIRDGKIPLTMILVIVLYLGEQVVDMVTVHNRISEFAHIVGGICGCFFGFSYGKIQEKNRQKKGNA